jgi:type I restriction enzyme, S subunit
MVSKATGANYPAVSDKIIKQSKIPLPPIVEQLKIATILDAADSLRQKDQKLVERYTALSQSLFLEMFGDPVTNPMGWSSALLEDISDIVSGVTKGRKLSSDEVFDIPYMRVANVQDGYLDLNEIKNIPGSKEDLEKYILQKGDVLLTEGGDPDKLGRGAVWNGEIKNCIHQNHIFRVRLTSQTHIPLYLSKLCGSEYGKRYFIKSGKQTTGIASINKTQLRRFPVLCPPVALQKQFAERIQLIEGQKQQAQRSLETSQALFHSLLQRAFTGELTAKRAA